ncbi:MAG: tRNA (guanosine(46)-N7)-methyltransferase TrmB [Candidatus Margulisiibacteriota bacterium]
MANPLHNIPEVSPLRTAEVFAQKQPLVLEIGFGFGKFFLEMAQKYPEKNFIGLETRRPFVELIRQKLIALGLKNAHVIHANANFGLAKIFKKASVAEIFILFPDPWIKRKHIKRRLINQPFLKDLHKVCARGAKIHIKTDEKFLYDDIRQHFITAKLFKKARNTKLPFLTNREEKYLKRGKKIWQLTLVKN